MPLWLRRWPILLARTNRQVFAGRLSSWGPSRRKPLLAVLASSDSRLVVHVLDVLGQIENPTVADYLLAPALAPHAPAEVAAAGHQALATYFTRLPNATQAAARLHERVRTLLDPIPPS